MTGLEVDNTIEGLLLRYVVVLLYIYIYAINMTLTYEILSEILLYIYLLVRSYYCILSTSMKIWVYSTYIN